MLEKSQIHPRNLVATWANLVKRTVHASAQSAQRMQEKID